MQHTKAKHPEMANESNDSEPPSTRGSSRDGAARPSMAPPSRRSRTRQVLQPADLVSTLPLVVADTDSPGSTSSTVGISSNASSRVSARVNALTDFRRPATTQSTNQSSRSIPPVATAVKRSFDSDTEAVPPSMRFKKRDVLGPKASVRRQSASAPAFGDVWISVSVGAKDSPTSFMLHKELASKESAFIEAAFRHEWLESEQGTIHLPDHRPEHFRLFSLWIYTRTVYSADQGDKKSEAATDSEWDLLAGAWALGAYLQAPDFNNAVVDAIVEKMNIGTRCVQTMHETIYPISQPNAPIRKLLVHIATRRWSPSTLKTMKNDPSWSDFFYDLSVAVMDEHYPTDRNVIHVTPIDAGAYHEKPLDKSAY